MADSQLFEETFSITSLNAQKYDRVSRISGTSSSNETFLTLDVNTELYPCVVGDRVHLVLASTLSLDGTKDDGKGWRDVGRGEASLADMYDYVCHGKIYRFEEGDGEMIKVFISFGGLLLYLEGPYKRLTPLRIDYVYLLLKKS
ncbi:DNA-directed RNA polymerases I, II, and III subunit RPABC3 [Xylographa trunciseda]|nr:DNA-directed RNA polymerases I, II, and III subunit RPABC3 [Xylographa trunciseda]